MFTVRHQWTHLHPIKRHVTGDVKLLHQQLVGYRVDTDTLGLAGCQQTLPISTIADRHECPRRQICTRLSNPFEILSTNPFEILIVYLMSLPIHVFNQLHLPTGISYYYKYCKCHQKNTFCTILVLSQLLTLRILSQGSNKLKPGLNSIC